MVQGTGSHAGRVGWSVGRFDWLDDPSSKVNRYWRSIEYGSNGWASGQNRIVGLWSNSPGKNPWSPGSTRLRSGSLSPMGVGGDQKLAPFFATRNSDMGKAAQAALMYYFGMQGGRVQTARANLEELRVDTDSASNRRQAKDSRGHLTGKTESRGSGPAAQRRALFMLLRAAGEGKKVPFVVGDITRTIPARNFYTRAAASFKPAETEMAALERRLSSYLDGVSLSTSGGLAKARKAVALDSSGHPRKGPRGGKNPVTDDTIRGYLGSRQGVASVAASVTAQDFLRDGRGFSNGVWQEIIRDVNREVANAFKDEVVSLMRQQPAIRRPTNDLIAAHDNPKNVYPD